MLRSGSARGQELKSQARLRAVAAHRHVTAAQDGRIFDATIQPNSRTTPATPTRLQFELQIPPDVTASRDHSFQYSKLDLRLPRFWYGTIPRN
jgi:hypothetical protein